MASILTGIDALIDQRLGLPSLGSVPQYQHKRSAIQLTSKPPGFDSVSLIQDMSRIIEKKWKQTRGEGELRSRSRENWRWKKQLYISAQNSSREKQIEKAIAAEGDEAWVNQVPTMSGLIDSASEKHCNLDLVHRKRHGSFEFIELKIESDTPLYAAFEVLKYGLVYVFSRNHSNQLGYDPANVVLTAAEITLSVLAPSEYYADYDLRWLEAELCKGLRAVGVPGLTMDFRFEQFPKTNSLAEIVRARMPVYSTGRRGLRVDSTGRAYAGSQRQIQTYVNDHPEVLTAAVCSAFNLNQETLSPLTWVSPLAADGYREYRDGDFLRAVGLGHFEPALKQFWPQRGPCWDALARIPNGCILVEAKSHVPEVYGGGCGAGEKSRPTIVSALEVTKRWMGVRLDADWLGSLYQSANRYAFLFFLREICKVDAFLVNVYFLNDPHSPTSRRQWEDGLDRVGRELGMESKAPFCGSVFLEGAHR